GEATVENNRWPFVVKVLRDKVRVLHVAGRPDWDVRALRTLLRKDPNVELLSYYILRSHEDSTRERSDARLSLIAFPTAELFEAELGSFDLVVLHNFDAAHHDVGRYLDNIARYVAEGGALVVIGGDLGLATGDYANRPLAAIMPVDIERPTGLSTDGLRPQLTEAGHRHPATARLSSAGLDGWSGLPTLDSYNPVTIADDAAEIGAEILMTRADGAPVLVVAEPGPGRVMVLATGATWRMGFAEDLPLFEGARPYDLLWLGAIRWLLRDAANERLTLETDRPAYRVDEPVTLRASTLSPSYAPEQDVTVDWSLSALGDESRKELRRGTWVTDALGRAHETLEPLPSGAYEAVATRPHDGEPRPDAAAEPEPDDERDGPHARRVFLVRDAGRELAHVDADPGTKLLDRLARETGGIHLSARAGESLPDEPPARPRGDAGDLHIDSRRKLPLWSGLPALLLVLGGLCGEWLVRRRNGLV
ncbi:MAG: hypothetical protein KC636_27525, partial [Myxococcales bacterium]|nr:hypothetical protein [Myxococcales bacterium]